MQEKVMLILIKKDGVKPSHRVYADIQLILSGEEYIGYNKTSLLSRVGDYDSHNDIQFFKAKKYNAFALPHNFPLLRLYFSIIFPITMF